MNAAEDIAYYLVDTSWGVWRVVGGGILMLRGGGMRIERRRVGHRGRLVDGRLLGDLNDGGHLRHLGRVHTGRTRRT